MCLGVLPACLCAPHAYSVQGSEGIDCQELDFRPLWSTMCFTHGVLFTHVFSSHMGTESESSSRVPISLNHLSLQPLLHYLNLISLSLIIQLLLLFIIAIIIKISIHFPQDYNTLIPKVPWCESQSPGGKPLGKDQNKYKQLCDLWLETLIWFLSDAWITSTLGLVNRKADSLRRFCLPWYLYSSSPCLGLSRGQEWSPA